MPRLADPLSCPVCDAALTPSATACPSCGLPVGLREDAKRALAQKDPYVRPTASLPSPRRASAAKGRTKAARAPVEATAAELDRALALLAKLDGRAGELGPEIHRAAWAEIRGDPSEAIRVLNAAIGRANSASLALVDRRWKDLEARLQALGRDGLAPRETPGGPVPDAIRGGRLVEAADLLERSERELEGIEREVQALRAPLREIESLFLLSERAGLGVPHQRAEVRALREGLSGRAGSIADGARRAEELLAALRSELPTSFGRELARHASALEAYPAEHAPAAAARSLHARARQHLERGNLSDAAEGLASLREAIRNLGSPPIAPSPSAEPRPPALASDVRTLLETARRLAAHVRTLPPESDAARNAAAEIRRATDLVREKRLPEAQAALDRLVETLEVAPPGA